MNPRLGRGGGPARRRREGSGAPRTRSSDRRPRLSCRVTAARAPRGGGRGGRERAGSEDRAGPASARGPGRQDVVAVPSDILPQPRQQPPPPAGRATTRPHRRRDPGSPEGGRRRRVPRGSPGHSQRPRPGAALGARGAGAPGRGMGPGGGPGLGSRSSQVPRAVRPAPAPRPRPAAPAPPRTAPAPAPGPAPPRYLGSGPTGRSPRRCHSALRETHTARLDPRAGRRPQPRSARRPARPAARGRGHAGAGGAGRRAAGGRAAAGLPRIRRFFSERPRPIAAILTGFSHNTGNLAQSRENPAPPARRPRPSPPRPRPSAAAAGGGRVCSGTPFRAYSGSGCHGRLVPSSAPAAGRGGDAPALRVRVGGGGLPRQRIPRVRACGVGGMRPLRPPGTPPRRAGRRPGRGRLAPCRRGPA